jgi:hypothetical protein
MHIHGRRSLALVVSADAVASSYVVLSLLLSDFDGYDLFFLALHLPHLFTILLGYVSVHYASTSLDTLRVLMLCYIIALVLDLIVLVVRLGFSVHSRQPRLVELTRASIALFLVASDACGAFFADMSRASAHLLRIRSDEQLLALARHQHKLAVASAAQTSNNSIESRGGSVEKSRPLDV